MSTSRLGERGLLLLEPPKRSPRPSLLSTVPFPVGVLPSAATRFPASPPGRATDSQTTECQGRAGGGGTVWGRACLGLDIRGSLDRLAGEAAASLCDKIVMQARRSVHLPVS